MHVFEKDLSEEPRMREILVGELRVHILSLEVCMRWQEQISCFCDATFSLLFKQNLATSGNKVNSEPVYVPLTWLGNTNC